MESVEATAAGTLYRAYCEPHAVAEAKALLVTVQDRVRNGFVMREEGRFPVGWTHYLLRRHEGAVVLHEPNYATNPLISYRADVTTSVRVHRDMLACAHARGVMPVFPLFSDLVRVAPGWRTMTPLRMVRDADGWLLAGDGNHVRIYELLGARPEVLPLLALPVGEYAL